MRAAGHDNYATSKLILGLTTGLLVTGLSPLLGTVAVGFWVIGSVLSALVYLNTAPKARANSPFIIGLLLGEAGWGCLWGCLWGFLSDTGGTWGTGLP